MISPLWFPVFFVAVWCGALGLVSLVSGWRSLAKHYRGEPASVVERVTFGSGQIGLLRAHYNNSLSVSVGPSGVGLKVLLPFRLFHPPLLVPWSDIEGCERWKTFGLFDRTRLRLVGGAPPIVFAGRAARLVGDACGATQPSRSLPAA